MANIELLVGENIRDRRKKMGWSQADLGKACGLNVLAVNRIEQGKQQPRRPNLLAIASALSCSIDDLYAPAIEADSPSLKDGISVLQAYEAAGPASRQLAMAVLTGDASSLDPSVLVLLETLLPPR